MDPMVLTHRFDHYMIDTKQQQDIDAVRLEIQNLALNLNDRLPEGRYKSLCLTALEEAHMWANKSISHEG